MDNPQPDHPPPEIPGFQSTAADNPAQSSGNSSVMDTQLAGDGQGSRIADSGLVAAPISGPGSVAAVADAEVKVAASIGATVAKRKRGRPPKNQVTKPSTPPPPPPRKKDEEDVCFICLDGGNLVLCDHRDCPKAYHPSCIKRDEAFFRSKAKWNCGWHICSSCQKTSHYMCYTCPYSVCRGCIKDADYFCVRENKGFCGLCMKTVKLIENHARGSQETAHVDFDDQSSWEYLFKVYWICLKEKLSLRLDELTQAKSPWTVGYLGDHKNGISDSGPRMDTSCHNLKVNNSKRRKTNRQSKLLNQNLAVSSENLVNYRGTSLLNGINKQPELCHQNAAVTTGNLVVDRGVHSPEGAKWASDELLEFVAHMKNGDMSVLSQLEVQALLLDYIRRNNLRDPQRKCEVICDSRLLSLFRKERVEHFEMIKLLQHHIIRKANSKTDSIFCRGAVDAFPTQMDIDASNNSNNHASVGNDERQKTEETGPCPNPNEYAAIDVHNINLIYLRRNLMERILHDINIICDKIIGLFVRIKISRSDQKEDLYRLVQVVGTGKAGQPYKVGNKMVEIMLEVLNVYKKEFISIDGISNEDFSEDECRRLRETMKCGLIKPLTVGEIQGKARTLQTVRVNNLLENQQRMLEISEVHADRSMDPCYDSEEDRALGQKNQDKPTRQRNSDSSDNRRDPNCSCEEDSRLNQVDPASSVIRDSSNQVAVQSKLSSGSMLESSLSSQFIEPGKPVNNSEAEGVWQFLDPSGIVQGPFSLSQLKVWSSNGHLPSGLSIWRINETQDSSVCLTDALRGQSSKVPLSLDNSQPLSQHPLYSQDILKTLKNVNHQDAKPCGSSDAIQKDDRSFEGSQLSSEINLDSDCCARHELMRSDRGPPHNVKATPRNGDGNNWESGSNSCASPVGDNHCFKASKHSTWNDIGSKCNGQNEIVRGHDGSDQSSNLNRPADVANSSEQQTGNLGEVRDSQIADSTSLAQNQVCNSIPSPRRSENHPPLSDQIKEDPRVETCNSGQSNANGYLCNTAESHTQSGVSNDKESVSEGHSSHSSGQSWRPPQVVSPTNCCDSKSAFPSVANFHEAPMKNHEIDFLNLPSATGKPSSGCSKGQDAENKQPVSGFPLLDAGLCSSSISGLVVSGGQLPDASGGWGVPLPTLAKSSVQDLISCLVSTSPMRTAEMAGDHAATLTLGSEQVRYSSPSHPAPNPSNWPEVVDEPSEFSWAEESVSDLLARVEAMECLNANAPGTPTSVNWGGELGEGSGDDCFTSLDGFSSAPLPARGDAVGTTSSIIPSQSMIDGLHSAAHPGILDHQKRLQEHLTVCSKAEGDTKHGDGLVNRLEAVRDVHPLPSTADTHWRDRPETMVSRWGPMQESATVSWGGLPQRQGNLGWGTSQGAMHQSLNLNLGFASGNKGMWENQLRYGGERSSPRERSFHGAGYLGFGGSRSSGNREAFGSGRDSVRHLPRGQRVCKFYESGHCKKGSSCAYLHP